MNNLKPLVIILCVFAILSGCGGNKYKYPLEKRYWAVEDYGTVIDHITYQTESGTQYPRFSDPETSPIIKKLVDVENFEVILADPELGLNFKSDVASDFFSKYREMSKIYHAMDRQDKYVYAEELIAIEKFGLALQIKYFRLGNDKINEQADPTQLEATQHVLNSNVKTVINNFMYYLDYINEEQHFGTYAPLLAEGVTIHFFKLIETFPEGNYDAMLTKVKALLGKTKVDEIKVALTKLIAKLESKKESLKM